MKYTYPDYYPEFSCISKNCRHNCCIGWEIDIDDDTLEYYQHIGGKIGKRLCEEIVADEGAAHFRLGKEERCPFLNQQGLCDLISQLGEGSLSQICSDHPRFRSFFSDREEIGLGLCCEEAGRIILSDREPVSLITEETDEPEDMLTADEKYLLSLRSSLIQKMQNRTLSFSKRLLDLFSYVFKNPPKLNMKKWADFFLSLERMDEAWTDLLKSIPENAQPVFFSDTRWDIPFEQLCVYLLYRHLPLSLEDGLVTERICFAGIICMLLGTLCAEEKEKMTLDTLIDYARLYSCEIEYSDVNLDDILEKIHEKLLSPAL